MQAELNKMADLIEDIYVLVTGESEDARVLSAAEELFHTKAHLIAGRMYHVGYAVERLKKLQLVPKPDMTKGALEKLNTKIFALLYKAFTLVRTIASTSPITLAK